MDLIDILLANAIISKKLLPAILNLKGSVSSTSELPLTGNHKGDVWVVTANNSEWVWMSDNGSGSLSDYEDFGTVIDLSSYRTAADQDAIDSGKQSKITAAGMLKGNGNGGVSAAVAGTDYDTASNIVSATAAMTPEQAAQTRQNIGAGESVIYAESKTIKVGDNKLGSATLGTGWTENDGSYTHESGNTEELRFNTSLSEDDVAILDFDTSFTTGEFITVGIGMAYKILVYNSSSHIRVPLKAIGNTTLHIVPLSTFNGSISNLTLRIIQDSGTEITLEYKDVLTVNHDNTYGFWNTLLGYNTADDAVGSTRCVAIGYNALRDLQGGHRNIGIGTFALSQLIGGERNVSIGADSMLGVKGGERNISIGDGALYNGTAPESNVSIGSHANYGNASKSPKGNVVVGVEAGFYNEGDNNVFLGKQAGYRNRTGSYNIMIGGQAFGSNGGNGNTLIGYNQLTTTPLTGAIGLGSDAVPTKSYQMMLGSNVITEVVLCGNKKLIFNNDGTVTWETLT